jgi:cell division septation protein DedD
MSWAANMALLCLGTFFLRYDGYLCPDRPGCLCFKDSDEAFCLAKEFTAKNYSGCRVMLDNLQITVGKLKSFQYKDDPYGNSSTKGLESESQVAANTASPALATTTPAAVATTTPAAVAPTTLAPTTLAPTTLAPTTPPPTTESSLGLSDVPRGEKVN